MKIKDFALSALTKTYILLVLYPMGIALAMAFLFFRYMGLIRLVHWERFPHRIGKLIVVSNHPSILDIFLVPVLFYKGYLVNPFRYGPLVIADRRNFYDSWYFFWLRPFMISVERGKAKSEAAALLRVKRALDQGRIIVIFPEGGRTCKGNNLLRSPKGATMRPLKESIGLLVAKTSVPVLLIWIKGSDATLPNEDHRLVALWRLKRKEITIKVGGLMRFNKNQQEDEKASAVITNIISEEMLHLADEE
jgi:1-acyl-sn-glycerol-3-phosphate acyltransferase